MCLNLYVIMEMQIQTTRMTKVNTTVRQFQMLSEDVKQIELPTSSGESEHWGPTSESTLSVRTQSELAHSSGPSNPTPSRVPSRAAHVCSPNIIHACS